MVLVSPALRNTEVVIRKLRKGNLQQEKDQRLLHSIRGGNVNQTYICQTNH